MSLTNIIPLKSPECGTADAEIKDASVDQQSSKVLPIEPGVGQNISLHASPTARDFFLELISTFLVHSSSLLF